MSAGRRVAVASLAAVFLSPVPALPADPAPAKYGRFKIGPVYLTPRVVLSNIGIDSNVYNTRTDPVADSAALLTPSLEAVLPVGRHFRLRGTGALILNFFGAEKSERFTGFAGACAAEADAGPLGVRGSIGGGETRGRASIEFDQRLLHQDQDRAVGVTLRLGRRLSMGASAGQRETVFERGFDPEQNQVKAALDRNSLRGSVTLGLSLTDQTSLHLSAETIEDRFVGDPTRRERARSYRYMGGFSFGLLAVIHGEVMAGYREYTQSSDVPPFSGTVVSAQLTVPLPRIGRLVTQADRDVTYAVTPGAGGGRNAYVLDRYRGEIEVELPWRFIARPLALFEQASFLLPVETDGRVVDRADRVWTFGGGLLRAFGRSIRVGGHYEMTTRRSNVESRSFRGARYGLLAILEVTP